MSKKRGKAIEVIVARTILGGCLLLFGMNQFHGVLGGMEMSGEGASFINALKDTGYIFYVIKGVEFIGGCLLISGFFVPLANLMIFPVVLNIFLFHIFLSPQGFSVAMLMAISSLTIFWQYREMFKFLIQYNASIRPNSTEDDETVPYFSPSEKKDKG